MNKSDDKNFEIAMLSGEIASNRHNGASRYVATILLFNNTLLTDAIAESKNAPCRCLPCILAQEMNQHSTTPRLHFPSQKERGKGDKT